MPIERRNPVPKGRYWADIIDSKSYPGCSLAFTEWLAKNKKSVVVVQMKQVDSTDMLSLDAGYQYSPKRRWYLFDVTSPVVWPKNAGFGLPNIVRSKENPTAPVVTSPADTATKPPPQSGGAILSDWFAQTFSGATGCLLLAGIAWALSSNGSKR
jgi:hypothetical protein